uniref:PDZ GRASP-type domain-containing protein n=1 Tax=Chromera velia CCMP2878 TaxID=1169474 RepID=A0A0G4HLE1_9ALVE|eukprot:Cvel_1138.t1-p1 / transcript=Cvel_1138.t1 / gene=Cvel_1138 / organism=Chromera_velia_CCMP2878 / gene_product=Golgi reassembly-stacking protein 1, putative / transcript_product=Golgi reassembly-stacking protein 1, putative / location=Cvel_scaffold37:139803-146957(+) / protein_length=660 / sequence_SO=supercontig / SO=protein_coding / is_pseudo=false
MGAGQSDESGSGFRVFKVGKGSPADKAGLEVFFDFIFEVEGHPTTEDQRDFFQRILVNKDRNVRLTVYNSRLKAVREVTVVPQVWGGPGLLGSTVRYASFADAETQGVRVLEVFPQSPAARCGLVPFKDWLLGSNDHVLRDAEDLVDLVNNASSRKTALPLSVYNADSERIREVEIFPTSDWGGEGSLGCDIGTGLLHRIPAPRGVPVKKTSTDALVEFFQRRQGGLPPQTAGPQGGMGGAPQQTPNYYNAPQAQQQLGQGPPGAAMPGGVPGGVPGRVTYSGDPPQIPPGVMPPGAFGGTGAPPPIGAAPNGTGAPMPPVVSADGASAYSAAPPPVMPSMPPQQQPQQTPGGLPAPQQTPPQSALAPGGPSGFYPSYPPPAASSSQELPAAAPGTNPYLQPQQSNSGLPPTPHPSFANAAAAKAAAAVPLSSPSPPSWMPPHLLAKFQEEEEKRRHLAQQQTQTGSTEGGQGQQQQDDGLMNPPPLHGRSPASTGPQQPGTGGGTPASKQVLHDPFGTGSGEATGASPLQHHGMDQPGAPPQQMPGVPQPPLHGGGMGGMPGPYEIPGAGMPPMGGPYEGYPGGGMHGGMGMPGAGGMPGGGMGSQYAYVPAGFAQHGYGAVKKEQQPPREAGGGGGTVGALQGASLRPGFIAGVDALS